MVVRFGSRNMEVVDAETGGRLICTMPGRFRLQGSDLSLEIELNML